MQFQVKRTRSTSNLDFHDSIFNQYYCRHDDLSVAEGRARHITRIPNRYPMSVKENQANASKHREMQTHVNEASNTQEIVNAFVANETGVFEYDEPKPKTIHEARNSKYWPEWLSAIHQELASLEAMEVYQEVEELPPGKKAVGSKWVLVLKRDENGNISRFKVRLVAQGFTQIPGQDFTHTFAPVARWDSIRFVLSVAAMNDWDTAYRHQKRLSKWSSQRGDLPKAPRDPWARLLASSEDSIWLTTIGPRILL